MREPWGTPYSSISPWDSAPLMHTYWKRSQNYEHIHSCTVPVIPNLFSSSDMSNTWSTVMNTVERSKRDMSIRLLLSIAQRRSLKTLTKAVSTLWPFLYANCSIPLRSFVSTWQLNLLTAYPVHQLASNCQIWHLSEVFLFLRIDYKFLKEGYHHSNLKLIRECGGGKITCCRVSQE